MYFRKWIGDSCGGVIHEQDRRVVDEASQEVKDDQGKNYSKEGLIPEKIQNGEMLDGIIGEKIQVVIFYFFNLVNA